MSQFGSPRSDSGINKTWASLPDLLYTTCQTIYIQHLQLAVSEFALFFSKQIGLRQANIMSESETVLLAALYRGSYFIVRALYL